MRTLLARSQAILIALLLTIGFTILNAPAANAVDEGQKASEQLTTDQLKRLAAMNQDQRNEIRDSLIKELAKINCTGANAMTAALPFSCEGDTVKAFSTFLTTPEQALQFDFNKKGQFLCGAYEKLGNPAAAAGCATQILYAKTFEENWPLIRAALATSPAGQVLLGTIDVAVFIKDANDGMGKLANDTKDGAVKAVQVVLNTMTSTSSFTVDNDFRTSWAAFAGLGLALLAGMLFKLFRDISNEEEGVSLDDLRKSLIWYAPLSMVLVVYGPALAWRIQQWMNDLTSGATGWAAGKISEFMVVMMKFADMTSGGAFTSVAGVLLFGLLFIGAWGVYTILLLQPFALMMIGAGIALIMGFLIHPKYRPRVAKVAALWGAISFSKVLFFLLAGTAFGWMAHNAAFQDGASVDSNMVNAGAVLQVAAVLLLFTFSPMLLFSFVPILPQSATSIGHQGPSIVGPALLGGAAAGVSQLIRSGRSNFNRSSNQSQRSRVDRSSATNASTTSSSSTSSSSPSGPGQGPGGGNHTSGQGATNTSGRPETGRRSAARSVGRGVLTTGRVAGKVAVGGTTTVLMAGREAARVASMRGRRAADSMAPDTSHISGR